MCAGICPAPGRVFVFGEFELDADSYQLRRRGLALRLENIPLQLLLLLVERTGQVVSRKEIAERLWGNVFLDVEQGINTAIRKIRLVLQDRVTQPLHLQTLVGKGYRFLPPPKVNETNSPIAISNSQLSESVITITAEELGQAILCAADIPVSAE